MQQLALVLLTTVAVASACRTPPQATPGADSVPGPGALPAREVTVTLLHFSDYHSHALPYFSEHAADQGGIARTLAYIKRRRAERPYVLVLSGGDMWNSGTPAFSDKYHGDCTEWRWLSDHVAAMALGNHDVDYGWQALMQCRAAVRFPILSANLVDRDGKLLLVGGTVPYVIQEFGGVRIGAFALSGPDFVRLVRPANLPPGARFTDPIAAAQRVVRALREVARVDAVVFFGHQDRESDFAMARAVPGIDLILGTHSHYKGELQQIPGTSTYFISPFQYLNYLSEVELTFRAGKLSAVRGGLVRMDSQRPQDPQVAAQLQSLEAALESDPSYTARFRHIGSAAVELDSTGIDQGESVLGNFAMDVVRRATRAHAALSTASSFRASIPPGPMRLEDYLSALPYTNKLLTVRMTGTQLQALLDLSAHKRGSDNFGVSSGVRYTLTEGRAKDVSVVVDPTAEIPRYEPLRRDRVYTVATTDYLANIAAEYKDLFDAAQDKTDTGQILNDTIIAYIRAHSPVAARLEGRITVASEATSGDSR